MQTSRDDHAPWRFHITMPVNGSHTGRYALLQAVSACGYPNVEDYILLARDPGGLFRAVYSVHVPFDEEPPILLDYTAHPDVAVVYQDFTLAWTHDGGRTIRTPPDLPEGLFKLWRFGAHRIDWVRLKGEYLYIKMAAGRHARQQDRKGFVDHAWRVSLDGGAPAERADPPADPMEPTVESEIFVRVLGSRLMVRASPETQWIELTPDALLGQLERATVDFFGGTGARYIP